MEIEKAFKRLLVKNPFYGLFCLSLPKVVNTKIPTMCVTKQGINCQLNINPDFWNKHTDDEQIALLQHEIGHICLHHMFLDSSFADHKAFNVAADAEINSYIENLPKDGVTPDWLSKKLGKRLEKGIGTKKYYEAIQDYINQQQAKATNPQMPCNGGMGGGSGSSQGNQQPSPRSSSTPSGATPDNSQNRNSSAKKEQPSSPQENKEEENNPQEEPQEQLERSNETGEGPMDEKPAEEPTEPSEVESQYPDEFDELLDSFDDHSTWREFKDIPEATQQLMENNINTILKNTAEQIEKMRGTIPGEFSEMISKLKEKKPEVFNWKAYFRRLLGSIYDVNIRSTRRKESKRFSGSAGIQHKKKVSILVAIDTSGSVSAKELQEFFSEIDYVFKAGARVTIIQCDTGINGIEDYDGKNIPVIKGRGGTDFNPPVDYYVKNRKEYASLIYFTDGYAPMPTKTPEGVVWVISSNGCHQDYPGKTIYIPNNNNQNN